MRFIKDILRCLSIRRGVWVFLAGTLSLAAAAHAEECGNGVQLRLSAPDAAQGSLLLVTVRSEKPLAELAGKWNEREVPFWQAEGEEHGGAGTDVRRALLGVDLQKPAGKYEFSVAAQLQGGERVSCRAMVDVNEGHFATENLTVKKQFIEPDPEQVARAEAETKRLREIFDRVTPERLWTGPFRVPLDGVFHGTNFGRRRVLNGHPGSPHTGVDFPAPTGTPVHAAQSGRVVLAEPLFFSGNTVIVDHGLGIYTFYGHFSEIDAKVGDTVKAGAVLGKVGATGRVTGPHLHWGLTVERSRVNALDILRVLGRG
ncbi:MAG: M23 family metallopeptidase [Candidatus Acidiferrales bacterium]